MNSMKYDVVVIGGGVIGCAVARELSRYQVKACVVEREEDVCSGTSKANSAIVHGGFDAEPGSLKAKFNILGRSFRKSWISIINATVPWSFALQRRISLPWRHSMKKV